LNRFGLRRTYPLGVFRDADDIALIGREKYSTTYRLVFGHGTTAKSIKLAPESPSIVLPLGRKEHLAHLTDIRVSEVLGTRIMTYTTLEGGVRALRVAIHDDTDEMDIWDVPSINRHLIGTGMIVPEYMHMGQYVMVYGDFDVRVAFSKNLVAWHTTGHALASPRKGDFDPGPLKVISAVTIEQGLLVTYESRTTRRGRVTITFGLVLLDLNDPEHVIWRSDESLGSHTFLAKSEPRTLGSIVTDKDITFYLSSTKDKLLTLAVPNPYYTYLPGLHGADAKSRAKAKALMAATRLHRARQNPVLSPSQLEWESMAVFNPAAFYDRGRIHLLYRAMGPDGVSRIGYASSPDGVNFDERLDYPVYVPSQGFGAPGTLNDRSPKKYDLQTHPSGGGWAGCEDPRVVVIDDHAYMSFVAFDGWSFIRQALTAIPLDDFHDKKWTWRKPVLISPPNQTHKNWVIFPEKINGKYAIIHGLSPKIHIEYVDSIDGFDGETFIESLPPAGGRGYNDDKRKSHWDNRVRGAGAPPLKTPMGWLLLYHANDKRDPGKYKLGAMLLDLNDPAKVLYRSTTPLLAPDEWYENDGKPGVVYTCGAVIVNENLVVYYGGGDKHIGVARANVQEFLNALIGGTPASLTRVGQV
jgi:predicted GH43/DUF377 family glycosyl hydrolase